RRRSDRDAVGCTALPAALKELRCKSVMLAAEDADLAGATTTKFADSPRGVATSNVPHAHFAEALELHDAARLALRRVFLLDAFIRVFADANLARACLVLQPGREI